MTTAFEKKLCLETDVRRLLTMRVMEAVELAVAEKVLKHIQASRSGEIIVPLTKGILKAKDVWCELGEVVAGLKQSRTSSDEVTVCVSSGLAL